MARGLKYYVWGEILNLNLNATVVYKKKLTNTSNKKQMAEDKNINHYSIQHFFKYFNFKTPSSTLQLIKPKCCDTDEPYLLATLPPARVHIIKRTKKTQSTSFANTIPSSKLSTSHNGFKFNVYCFFSAFTITLHPLQFPQALLVFVQNHFKAKPRISP